MIRPDVLRRFYFRGSVKDIEEISKYIDEWIHSVNWFEVYPELLAFTVGKYIGLDRHFDLEAILKKAGNGRFFNDDETAAQESANAANRLMSLHQNVLWLVHPTFWDLNGNSRKKFQPSYHLFSEKFAKSKLIDMVDHLPKPSSKTELLSWYNLPHDGHNSDKGLIIYGNYVGRLLIRLNSTL